MTRKVLFPIGKIVQNSILKSSNPLQNIILFKYLRTLVDDAGEAKQEYDNIVLQARIQPVSNDLMYRYNLEFGGDYKRFFILSDTINTTSRNTATSGDFIEYNNGIKTLFYRIVKIPNEFYTHWQEIIGMQTDTLRV